MILLFGSKETEKIWEGLSVKKLPPEIQQIGRKKLRMLNNAQDNGDLLIPLSNRSEKLAGNLAGYYSIRINLQWRIIFKWENGNSTHVQIIDYQ
jgi:proteic killer suppression protein